MTSRHLRSTIAAIASISMVFTGVVATPAFADETTTNNVSTTAESAQLSSKGPGYTFVLGPKVFSVVSAAATGFQKGDTLTATVNGKPAAFYNFGGGGAPVPTATVDSDEAAKLTIVTQPENARGGAPTVVVVKNAAGKTATLKTQVMPKISIGAVDAPGVSQTAIGSTAALKIVNIMPGIKVTAVGTEGTNFLAAPITVGNDAGVMDDSLKIPNDESLIGKQVFITFTAPGMPKPMTVPLVHTVITPASPLKDSDRVQITSAEIASGLYQSVYSPSQKKLFVTSAQFVGDNLGMIYKVDPNTLQVEGTIQPHSEGEAKATGASSPFGIAVVDSLNQLWVTNTLGDSVSVYSSVTGELLKQFPKGTVVHPRAITVDEANQTVYVSQPTNADAGLATFDAKSLELKDELGTGDFSGPMEIQYDKASNSIYTVGFKKREAAKIDLSTGKTTTYNLDIDAKEYRGGGVALDSKHNRLWVTTQVPSSVKVIDLDSGKLVKTIVPGGGPLDVLYDESGDAMVVVNRASGTATVIDASDYDIVANVNVGYNPNQASTDGMGHVFIVNKPSADGAAKADSIYKLTVEKKATDEKQPDNGGSSDSENSKVSDTFNDVLKKVGSSPIDSDKDGSDPAATLSELASSPKGMFGIASLFILLYGLWSYFAQAAVMNPFIPGLVHFPGMR